MLAVNQKSSANLKVVISLRKEGKLKIDASVSARALGFLLEFIYGGEGGAWEFIPGGNDSGDGWRMGVCPWRK
ncbi:hypothetical protein OIU74_024839 [Salix koriyanagi]|uniref:Uncharacterized protein n=1 Tax=Salix koriyanagi TaxID=2511006 RepID=A0A9Q0W7Q9_9ROSI|nr:hypothetical protein OIU74_024839 [Salix koriyanagi]